jgi:RNA polymerase sigma-70 factor (ECF subfamily)
LADTDEVLMRKVAKGDLAAFRLLMERWEGAAKRYAYRVFGDYHAAEDAAQETFVRLYRSSGRYEPTAKFGTYFYTVLGNLCRDRIRASRRRAGHGEFIEDVFVLDETAEAAPGLSPEPRVEGEEERLLVREAVAELPEKLREALSLREFEGLSYHEIADVMGANLGEVKTWIHRGRKRLAHSLRKLATPEERREQGL